MLCFFFFWLACLEAYSMSKRSHNVNRLTQKAKSEGSELGHLT